MMILEPVGKPKPVPISFGIYKRTVFTDYGNKMIGEYKGKTITVHNDIRENCKLIYVSRAKEWIKSKLIYFHNGIKNVIRSYPK